jgi:hypothetical protein
MKKAIHQKNKCSKCERQEIKWFVILPSGLMCNNCVNDLAKIVQGDGPPPIVILDNTGLRCTRAYLMEREPNKSIPRDGTLGGETLLDMSNADQHELLYSIWNVLYPNGDLDHQWSTDELVRIAELFRNAGLGGLK